MLKTLNIKNFAIIKNISIDFNENLNIITGNTGAGKSILFSALSLILGERADKSMIRTGEDFLEVLVKIDNDTIVRRISKDGKSTITFNDEKISLSELKSKLGGKIDIHGQFESQSILYEGTHIKILDDYIDNSEFITLKENFKNKYKEYITIKNRIHDLKYSDSNSSREIKLLKLELDEITKLHPHENEDEELKEQIKNLKNFENINEGLSKLNSLLNDDNTGVNDLILKIKIETDNLTKYFDDFADYEEEIETAKNLFDELNSLVANKTSQNNESNISDLDNLIPRLDKLENLKKSLSKDSLEEVISYKKTIAQRIEDLSDIDNVIEKLESEYKKYEMVVLETSFKISELREKNAKNFEKEIVRELNELMFNDAKFLVYFNEKPENDEEALKVLTDKGIDDISFLLSANKGSEPRPLSKIASGGEISRIMLAIKQIMKNDSSTLIFDEIDTGISGEEALTVGQKLKKLSENQQVILTTHLPQIAIFSNVEKTNSSHIKVEKNTDDEITSSLVKILNEEESVFEIARLLSGKTVTDSGVNQVRELINSQKSVKNNEK